MSEASDLQQNCGADGGPFVPGPHEANLFDINAKYGDVVALKDVMSCLQLLPGN